MFNFEANARVFLSMLRQFIPIALAHLVHYESAKFLGRGDVLIEMEEVQWIVFLLQLPKAIKVVAVRTACCGLAFGTHVIRVDMSP